MSQFIESRRELDRLESRFVAVVVQVSNVYPDGEVCLEYVTQGCNTLEEAAGWLAAHGGEVKGIFCGHWMLEREYIATYRAETERLAEETRHRLHNEQEQQARRLYEYLKAKFEGEKSG